MFASVLTTVFVSIARAKRGVFSALMDFASAVARLGRLQCFLLAHETTLREIDVHGRSPQRCGRSGWAPRSSRCFARIAMTGEIFFILRALGYDIPFTTALCIDAASSLALNVMFFVPFDLGVREGGLYLILPFFGLPPGGRDLCSPGQPSARAVLDRRGAAVGTRAHRLLAGPPVVSGA